MSQQKATISTQSRMAQAFLELHQQANAFIIPNPWDVGTTRLLSQMGFKALATTSAGCAFSAGCQDNHLGRDDILKNAKSIVQATHLPVSADLENGFGDEPEAVALTIKQAIEIGLAGGSIEDADCLSDNPIYPIELGVQRIIAAREAITQSGSPFVLTARAENFLLGTPDIKDTIKRLQAYQEAGADALYAPGIKSIEDISAVVSSLDKPVNVVMGLAGGNLTADILSDIGVKRISAGSSLARAALGAFMRVATEMQTKGSFDYSEQAINYGEISNLLALKNDVQ